MNLQLLGTIGIVYLAVVTTLSVFAYATIPWYKDRRMGWHLMAYMTAVAISLDLSAIRLLWNPGWLVYLRAFIFLVLLPIVLTWRLVLVAQGAIEYRREEEKE